MYKGKAAQTVTFAITILVAFVPEGEISIFRSDQRARVLMFHKLNYIGLPATVTLLLSIAAKRMAGRNVLVKGE